MLGGRMSDVLRIRAEELRALHHEDAPLVLPNAWDAATARAVAKAGFRAIATTSGGMAASLGFADHQQTPPDEMFAAIRRVSVSVEVPVTADVEAGYGLPPDELAECLLDAGAVGCNLEDTDHATGSLGDAGAFARYLAEVKAAAARAGVSLVVNARTDVFLHGDAPPEVRLQDALRRGRVYRDAGADCIYPIFARGREILRGLAEGLGCPVNAMATPGGLSVAELASLGIRRISFGTSLFAESLRVFEAALERIRASR
jgi:2-methylisocitrate lyase-like PEP mutase family enzyme